MSDIYLGDCREVRSVVADNSVDTIITDPPYGLEFMGKGWDKGVPGIEFWKEFLAVTKPGGMLLAFGGTRTFHRMTMAIEDAGWEIRDCMMWLYGSGFPKSLDISKAIDKAKGAERKVIGKYVMPQDSDAGNAGKVLRSVNAESVFGSPAGRNGTDITAPATNLARAWSGWGTALKPAWEPIIIAMKPLDGTFAENAEKWGVAGINVDRGRIPTESDLGRMNKRDNGMFGIGNGANKAFGKPTNQQGRWPANLILDEEAGKLLDGQSGISKDGVAVKHNSGGNTFGGDKPKPLAPDQSYGGSGGASRFFYCAKASKSERNAGCETLPEKRTGDLRKGGAGNDRTEENYSHMQNCHPTVKPLKLMEYLCTLTKTPTGGIVLDPFAGSGTTLLAAKNTGREYIGIEQNPEYMKIIEARLA